MRFVHTENVSEMMPICKFKEQVPEEPIEPKCEISNVKRDIIIFLDMIEVYESSLKFRAIEKLLRSIGEKLTISETVSRVALVGYGTNSYLYLQPFASSADNYTNALNAMLNHTSPRSISNFANLPYAIEKFLNMTNDGNNPEYSFRSSKDAVVLIIADNIPADRDTSLDLLYQRIRHIQRFVSVGVIAYTKSGVAREFSELISNNQYQKFDSYNELPEKGLTFATNHFCAYYVPDLPTITTTIAPTVSYAPTEIMNVAELHNINLMIVLEQTSYTEAVYNKELRGFIWDLLENHVQFSFHNTTTDMQYATVGLIQYSESSYVSDRYKKALRKANDAFLEMSSESDQNFTNTILIVSSGSSKWQSEDICYYSNELLSNGIKIVAVGIKDDTFTESDKQMLGATALLAKKYSEQNNSSCKEVFMLITYSSKAYSYIRASENYGYEEFARKVQELQTKKPSQLRTYGLSTSINQALFEANEALSDLRENPYSGQLVVVFIGQEQTVTETIDSSAVQTLSSFTKYVYVANINERGTVSKWKTVVDEKQIINEKQTVISSDKLLQDISQKIDDDFKSIKPFSRELKKAEELLEAREEVFSFIRTKHNQIIVESCNAEKAVDLLFVIHQGTDEKKQKEINKLAVSLLSTFNKQSGLFRIGVLQTDGNYWVKRIGIYDENSRIETYINSIPTGARNCVTADILLTCARKEYESVYSETGRRRFAVFSMVFITEATYVDVTDVKSILQQWMENDCSGVPKLFLINIGNFTKPREVFEEEGIYVIDKDDFEEENERFYNATNNFVQSFCSQIQNESKGKRKSRK
uniref:VWFA domain-containing protein n=1 Tax=Syphacia muris TaxID=451379 RepID=A0A0N5AHC0_9BILA